MIPVIDVSHHQDLILPWQQFRDAGVRGAIVRAHNGGVLDRRTNDHLRGALAVGMEVGLYWYVRVNLDFDPAEVALRDSFIAVAAAVTSYVCPTNVLWMADYERNLYDGVWDNPEMSPEVATWLAAYRTATSSTTREYGNTYLKPERELSPNVVRGTIAPRWPLANAPISSKADGWEALTKDWAHPTWPTKYDGWQFTSTGRLPGYSGNIDCNLIDPSTVKDCWPALHYEDIVNNVRKAVA